MNKTAITLNHIFADNTARDTYFTSKPLEKINLTFIKVGTGYQQLINGVWTSANPVITEVVTASNQPFTPVGGVSANNTQAAIAELDTKKANKLQEAWIAPTLLSGWTEVSGYPVRYMKDSLGFVHVKGAVIGGSGTLFNIPVGYRPPESTGHTGFMNNNGARSSAILWADSAGFIYCHSVTPLVGFIKLDSIIYKV